MGDLEGTINRLPEPAWQDARDEARSDSVWVRDFEWWNNKYYLVGQSDDGNVPQRDCRGNVEVPCERDPFHPCPTCRFSLGMTRVAYFSSDFATNCCETIEQFRDNPRLTSTQLSAYLRGESNPIPGERGYPTPFRIAREALILDLSKGTNSLIQAIVDSGPWTSRADMNSKILASWDLERKMETQALAIAARTHRFDGIVFTSVRMPKDVALPPWNLVMFAKDYVLRRRTT